MEKSYFFNSVNGDRKYLAEDFAAYFETFLSDGLFLHNADALKVSPYSGRTIRISSGKGYIKGYAYINTSNLDKTLDTAVANRIDRIVLRLDMTNRQANIAIKKGTAATTPVAPELIRTADIWELGLADIYLASGTTTITAAMITDLRNNGNYCGGVTITVDRDEAITDVTQSVATFTQASTRNNIEPTDRLGTLFGKIKKWFADLKSLAFKNTVAAADIDSGAITDAKIATNAAIQQSKVSGLTNALAGKANTSGDYQNIKAGGIIGNQVWSGSASHFDLYVNTPLVAGYRYAVVFNDGHIAEGIAADLGGGDVELTVTYAKNCYASDKTATIQIVTLTCGSGEQRTYYNGAYKIYFEGAFEINDGVITGNGYADLDEKPATITKIVKLEKVI